MFCRRCIFIIIYYTVELQYFVQEKLLRVTLRCVNKQNKMYKDMSNIMDYIYVGALLSNKNIFPIPNVNEMKVQIVWTGLTLYVSNL